MLSKPEEIVAENCIKNGKSMNTLFLRSLRRLEFDIYFMHPALPVVRLLFTSVLLAGVDLSKDRLRSPFGLFTAVEVLLYLKTDKNNT